jgi:NAD-dependent DNA ligase
MKITIQNKSFCFTGRAGMKRADLAAIVVSHGGEVHKRVTRATDYLVVGEGGSKRWAYRGFGNKILRARYLKAQGFAVRVVSERDFWRAAAG